MKPAKLIFIFIAGGLFGTGLAISGMTDPARVIGFLDVFGKWDPALLFVMAGAVGIYGIGMLALRRLALGNLKLPSAASSPIDRRLDDRCCNFRRGLGVGRFLSRACTRQSRRASHRGTRFCTGNGDWDAFSAAFLRGGSLKAVEPGAVFDHPSRAKLNVTFL